MPARPQTGYLHSHPLDTGGFFGGIRSRAGCGCFSQIAACDSGSLCKAIAIVLWARWRRLIKQLTIAPIDFSRVSYLALLASIALTIRFAKRRSKVVNSSFFLYRFLANFAVSGEVSRKAAMY
jgi:hypothetical protein